MARDGSILRGRTADELTAPAASPVELQTGRISAIKQQVKRTNRYSVFINEKYAFSLGESALLDQKLYIGKTVSPEELAELKDTSRLDKAYGLALAYVARRLRSEWELWDYFRRKEIDEDSGQLIIDRLRGFGYVSDLKFAKSWVDNRRAIKSVSRRRLTQELRQKRVPDAVIEQVLAADETTDQDTLRQLIYKKQAQSRYQDKTKLMQYLARQGYQYDDIKQALATSDDC